MADDQVYVVLDPKFGEKLLALEGQAVWITMSPANAPVVRSVWAKSPGRSHLKGVTGFTHEEIVSEERLLQEIDMIDLHHGPHSSKTPYTALKVIGSRLTPAIQAALASFGFSEFSTDVEGFTAVRTVEEAKKLRS